MSDFLVYEYLIGNETKYEIFIVSPTQLNHVQMTTYLFKLVTFIYLILDFTKRRRRTS